MTTNKTRDYKKMEEKPQFIPLHLKNKPNHLDPDSACSRDERPPFCEIYFEGKHKVTIGSLESIRKLKDLFKLDYLSSI